MREPLRFEDNRAGQAPGACGQARVPAPLSRRFPVRRFLALLTLLALLAAALADPPAGYYNAASGLSGAALKSALHGIIDGHTVIPYSSLETPLRALWQDPANSSNILLVYSQTSVREDLVELEPRTPLAAFARQ